MKNISNEINTHRTAIASAVLRLSNAALAVNIENSFELSRITGISAIKKTAELLPECHAVPISYAAIKHKVDGTDIMIEVEVQAIYRAGVAMEAMHGATVAALSLFQQLREIDPGVMIAEIKILKEKGHKQQYTDMPRRTINAAVVVCSDSIAAGQKQDQAGKAIIAKLELYGIKIADYCIIPDEIKDIREKTEQLCADKNDLVIFTGGTGLTARDITPEALRPLIDREIPGIAEAARAYGQEHMPYSMLSRSMAGLKGNTMILALPGSTRGAAESMDALFPYLLHYFRVMENLPHEDPS